MLNVFLGCSIVPPSPVGDERSERLFSLRTQQILSIDTWRFSARVVVDWQDQRWSGTLHWREGVQQQILDFAGPAGRGGGRMLIEENHAMAISRTGERFLARDPEELVEQLAGQRIPVAGLRYWVRGLVVPDFPGDRVLDQEGKLIRLAQNDWEIHYGLYQEESDMALPRSLVLNREDIELQVIIQRWEFGQNTGERL